MRRAEVLIHPYASPFKQLAVDRGIHPACVTQPSVTESMTTPLRRLSTAAIAIIIKWVTANMHSSPLPTPPFFVCVCVCVSLLPSAVPRDFLVFG